MRYRHLGRSGLEVSEVGVGANSFGEPNRTTYDQAKSIIDEAIDCGVNFVDTSNVYAQGVSEEYIGKALKGRRDRMLVGTKFGSRRCAPCAFLSSLWLRGRKIGALVVNNRKMSSPKLRELGDHFAHDFAQGFFA